MSPLLLLLLTVFSLISSSLSQPSPPSGITSISSSHCLNSYPFQFPILLTFLILQFSNSDRLWRLFLLRNRRPTMATRREFRLQRHTKKRLRSSPRRNLIHCQIFPSFPRRNSSQVLLRDERFSWLEVYDQDDILLRRS